MLRRPRGKRRLDARRREGRPAQSDADSIENRVANSRRGRRFGGAERMFMPAIDQRNGELPNASVTAAGLRIYARWVDRRPARPRPTAMTFSSTAKAEFRTFLAKFRGSSKCPKPRSRRYRHRNRSQIGETHRRPKRYAKTRWLAGDGVPISERIPQVTRRCPLLADGTKPAERKLAQEQVSSSTLLACRSPSRF